MGGDIEAFEDTVWVLVFNTRAEPFSNASVRRAYAHSLNHALFEGQLPQNLRAASTLIPPAVRMGGEAFRAYAGEDGPSPTAPNWPDSIIPPAQTNLAYHRSIREKYSSAKRTIKKCSLVMSSRGFNGRSACFRA